MVEQVVQAASREQAIQVNRIVVAVGSYSGVERSALEFAFPFAAENTMAEGAELEIEEVTGTAVCSECHAEFIPDERPLVCQKCGSTRIHVEGGREFAIRAVDLEIP